MNKKFNTVLFMIGATFYNLLVMAIIIVVPFIIILLVFKNSLTSSSITFIVMVLFVVALGGGFFIYRYTMKKIAEKVNMDKYFEPLFRKKKN